MPPLLGWLVAQALQAQTFLDLDLDRLSYSSSAWLLGAAGPQIKVEGEAM
jgi:hypothetical protein